MEIDHKAVEVVSLDGLSFAAEFRLSEVSPVNGESVRLELAAPDKLYVADIYPSGMSRSMGVGDKAYRLTMGRQAMMKDLVDIFDVTPKVSRLRSKHKNDTSTSGGKALLLERDWWRFKATYSTIRISWRLK